MLDEKDKFLTQKKNLPMLLIQKMWQNFYQTSEQMQILKKALAKINIHNIPLDHFALIDLPGPHSGRGKLIHIFSLLGYELRGEDYLPDKQNAFSWLAPRNVYSCPAKNALPQVVVADFRLDELPIEIRQIIEKYTQWVPIRLTDLNTGNVTQNFNAILEFLAGRDWPLPTRQDYFIVREFNELLAWVMIFGRKPNHFSLSIHLLDVFSDLLDFINFVNKHTPLVLNTTEGLIKGNIHMGIAQSATLGLSQTIQLADGPITIAGEFIEFVWRYPLIASPHKWSDYYTDFIAKQANNVIESLYQK